MIKIITDSTSYIPDELQAEYDITVLPLSVVLDGKEYLETEISNEHFYNSIKKSKEIPKTHAPEYDIILSAFEETVKEGNSIVGIFVSDTASDTLKNAQEAKKDILKKYSKANITLINSNNTAMALGLVVLSAAETYKRGAWLEDVVESAYNTIKRNRFLFVPKNLKHIEISGKIGKGKALVGDMLKLIPLLTSINGTISPLEMIRTYEKAMDRMVEIMKEDMDKFGINRVIVTHIDAIDEAVTLTNKVKEILNIDVGLSEIGPVVGANVGPGSIGLIYNTNEVHPLNA